MFFVWRPDRIMFVAVADARQGRPIIDELVGIGFLLREQSVAIVDHGIKRNVIVDTTIPSQRL